jgi:hypothetical protein
MEKQQICQQSVPLEQRLPPCAKALNALLHDA